MKPSLRVLEDAVGSENGGMDDGEASSLACAEVVEEMRVLEHQNAEE